MTFSLRYAGRDFPLSEGRFVIGRSEECQLCLDDPVASRQHAQVVVEGDVARLSDLRSRNGVYLNGDRVQGELVLKDGDKIRVGMQEVTFVRRSVIGRADTLVQRQTASGNTTFGVLGGLAEKAISMGRGDEAERILGRQLESIVEREERGATLQGTDFEKAVEYCLRIAELTKKARWVSCLFRLHAAHGKLMSGDMVNALYSVGPKLDASARPSLRQYMASLSPLVDSYAPGDRFVLKRLEGLEQVLR
jgi:hypothetical protein